MSEADNRAKLKYNQKTYESYAVKLHKDRDAELIAKIKALTDTGMSKSDAIKQLLR